MTFTNDFPQPGFDYGKWDGISSTIKLTSVNWDAKYNNVVDWESEEARDEYFEQKSGNLYNLETDWNFKSLEVFKPGLGKHVGAIRVPLPYEEAINFNYIAVVLGEQPVPGGGEPRREHYFYFLTSLNKIAPNTTELFLELDTWTTYRNSVEFSGMALSRGHYPMAITSADEYLASPLSKTYGLTEPEVTLPQVKPLVSSQNLVSFQKNAPRICIATTADFTKPESLWLDSRVDISNHNVDSVPAPQEYWWERPVSYEAGSGAIGNNQLAAKPAVAETQATVAGSMKVYSMNPTAYASFASRVRKRYPQLLKTIKAVYILDSSLIDEGPDFQAFGIVFKQVMQQNSTRMIEKLALSKELFGYKPEYADMAKLYTSQFATIKVSDLNGKVVNIAIEDIAKDLEFYARSLAAFPFLKLEAFINGIGGSEKKTYAVKPLNATNAELFKSSWEDYTFELEVPTFGVFAEAREIEGVVNQLDRFTATKDINLTRIRNTNNLETSFANANRTVDVAYTADSNILAVDYDNEVISINLDFTLRSREIALSLFESQQDQASVRFSGDTSLTNATIDIANTVDLATRLTKIEYSFGDSRVGGEHNITPRSYLGGDKLAAEDENVIYSVALGSADSLFESGGARAWYTVRKLSASAGGSPGARGAESLPDLRASAVAAAFGNAWSVNETAIKNMSEIARYSTILNVYEVADKSQIGVATSIAASISSIGGGVASAGLAGIAGVGAVAAAGPAGLAIGAAVGVSFLASGVNSILEGVKAAQVSKITTDYMAQKHNLTNPVTPQHVFVNSENPDTLAATVGDNYDGDSANMVEYRKSLSVEALKAYVDLDLLKAESKLRFNYETYARQANERTATSIANNELENVKYTVSTMKAKADESFRVNNLSNKDSKDTALGVASRGNQARKTSIDTRYNAEKTNIKASYDTESSTISREFTRNMGALGAQYAEMVYSEPETFGAHTGSAWIDSWGQRGLDVRVERISEADEIIVGNTFLRKGYTVSNFWIENIDLSPMTLFSYWEAEDVWVVGDKVNETNKVIFEQLFTRGVTVWRNPDQVKKVDIRNNKRRTQ